MGSIMFKLIKVTFNTDILVDGGGEMLLSFDALKAYKVAIGSKLSIEVSNDE